MTTLPLLRFTPAGLAMLLDAERRTLAVQARLFRSRGVST